MDRVICVNSDGVKLTEGKEYNVTSDEPSDPHLRLVGDDGREFGYYRYRFKPVTSESPIRTVTRREPVSGKYSNGDVDVSVHPDGQIQISVSMLTLKGDRVRSACMVLSQLAEFLDEDKGKE